MDINKLEKKKKYGWLYLGIIFFTAIIIICIGYRINYKMEFYDILINTAGSQRSTSIKILSDTERAMIYYKEGDFRSFENIKYSLFEDNEKIELYYEVMYKLRNDIMNYSISKDTRRQLQLETDDVLKDMSEYLKYVEIVMDNPQNAIDNGTYNLMVESAYTCFDELNEFILELQKNYENFLSAQKCLLVASFTVLVACSTGIIFLLKKVKIIEYSAKYDYLTGVRNISYLKNETKNFAYEKYALIFIDLNKFKQINDSFGHSVGDEILKEVGKRLNKELDNNLVFRYGGDEFVVFIKNENTNKIEEYINNINTKVFTTVIDSCGRVHKISGAVGVIGKDVTKLSVEAGVKIADSIMYSAKDDDLVLYAKTDEDVKDILEELKL